MAVAGYQHRVTNYSYEIFGMFYTV